MPKLPFNISSFRDGPVRTIDDASRFGVPVLAAIRDFDSPAGPLDDNENPEVLEAYRRLAERLHTSVFNVRGHVVVVASMPGGSGGTTTARNLATLLSRGGSKVILVDSNVKRVARRRRGDGSKSSGFAGLLMNQLMRPSSALVESDDLRLKLIPAGSTSSSPDDLLQSARLPLVVNNLCDLADYVVFDAGTVMADLPLLTRQADATLIVLRSGRTSRKDAWSAVEMLGDATSGLVGIVLNRLPAALAIAVAEAPEAPAAPMPETVPVAERRLEIAVEDLLADLEEAVSLIRELRRSAGDGDSTAEDDAQLVAAKGRSPQD